MTESQLHYVAGLFDGEGCICISKFTSNERGNRKYHQLKVKLEMSRAEIFMKELKEEFGGSTHNRRRLTGGKQMNVWQAESTRAAAFLTAILPFMRIKGDEARLAIEFQGVKAARNRSTRPLTDDEFILRESYYQRLRDLH